jgi:hypothetical protein
MTTPCSHYLHMGCTIVRLNVKQCVLYDVQIMDAHTDTFISNQCEHHPSTIHMFRAAQYISEYLEQPRANAKRDYIHRSLSYTGRDTFGNREMLLQANALVIRFCQLVNIYIYFVHTQHDIVSTVEEDKIARQ